MQNVKRSSSSLFALRIACSKSVDGLNCVKKCGCNSAGRVPAFQAGCRAFESRRPLHALHHFPKLGIHMNSKIDLNSYEARYSFNKFLKDNQGKKIILDLSKLDFVRPVDSVHLQCIVEKAFRAKNNGLIPNFNLKYPKKSDVNLYLGRIGIFKKLKDYEYSIEHDSNNFSELIYIENDRNAILGDKVQELLERGKFATSGLVDSLANSLTEIADNIFFHSGESYGEDWGYFIAQTYKETSLHMAFCDVGIGFRGSFERTGKFNGISDKDLIAKSFEESITSTDDPWRGIGLYQVYEFIRDFAGIMTIESGRGKVEIKDGKIFKNEIAWNMNGSLLSLSLPL